MEFYRKREIYSSPYGRFLNTHNSTMSYIYALNYLLKKAAAGSSVEPEEGLLGHAGRLAWSAVGNPEPGWFKRISIELLFIREHEVIVVYLREMLQGLAANCSDALASLRAEGLRKRLETLGASSALRFMRDELGVDLGIPNEEEREWARFAAERHVIVHRHGRVDRTFLERTGRKDLPIGSQLPIGPADIDRVLTVAHNLAVRVDDALVRRFGLAAFDDAH
jgi:hypothetical protein